MGRDKGLEREEGVVMECSGWKETLCLRRSRDASKLLSNVYGLSDVEV